jgi:hypothetical protein
MEHVRQKMEEIRQKQKKLQEDSQLTTDSSPVNDRSQYLLALGGIAAGLIIAVMVWLAKSVVTTDHTDMIAPEKAEAVYTGEIRKSSDNIALLNERVELLTESVSTLEARLNRVMVLTDSITRLEKELGAASRQQIPEAADARPAFDRNESSASRAVHSTPEAGKAFAATHTVKARVNLRPSASLNTTPVAVLDAGTEVEYIKKADDWYYVNTQFHGKGWCSPDYLSPVLPKQH